MPARSALNKEVRIQIIHDDKVVATRKGLEICNSVITWEWLVKARAALHPNAPFVINDQGRDVKPVAATPVVKKKATSLSRKKKA